MIAEGMVKEGLAVMRTIDERYDGKTRNPFNEVECGDHYARSMASYGALIAISGFEYHGPKRHIGFAPRLTPEDFKAPFTAAEGWGSYEQQIQIRNLKSEISNFKAWITLKYGKLRVKTIALVLTNPPLPDSATVMVNGRLVDARHEFDAGRLLITLAAETVIHANEALEVSLGLP
jgi:hypothetical protein